jgi:hypothetical protein
MVVVLLMSHAKKMKRINAEQMQIVNAAIDRAIADARQAMPDGNHQELVDWIMTHARPVFVCQGLLDLPTEFKDVVREVFRELGIPLYENFTPDGKTVKN